MDHTNLLEILSDNVKSIVIFTDCEPDDMIALSILIPRLKHSHIRIVVSGWKNPMDKCLYLREYLESLDIKERWRIRIYYGMSTNKEYDISPLIKDRDKKYDMEIESWDRLTRSGPTFILQLAPIFELMEKYIENKEFFNDKTLAIYGSFNVRSVMWKHSPELVRDMICSFKKVLYYETHYATIPTTVTDTAVINKILSIYPQLGDMVTWWNKRIYDEMKNNKGERAKKIVKSIDECSMQFVHADTGLVATLLLPLNELKDNLFTGTLSFSEPDHYSTFGSLVSSIDNKFLVVSGDDESKKRLYEKQMKVLI